MLRIEPSWGSLIVYISLNDQPLIIYCPEPKNPDQEQWLWLLTTLHRSVYHTRILGPLHRMKGQTRIFHFS
ncbi:hypothetical protein HanXRQr2_Chr08g0323741 [Helianthus annuus]|uniref:Uncharacterized protein n=1 Tax=Helianthus annuus TaxID=4232 RepID=A0A9K3NBG4_HELAN|nr:hypothetical protein HanXRQr2_Chr08g0323741 [Helianthus annuus]